MRVDATGMLRRREDASFAEACVAQSLHDVIAVVAKREDAFAAQRIGMVNGLEQMLDDAVAKPCTLDGMLAAVERHREHHVPARMQHAQQLAERAPVVGHVLEHLGVCHEIEARIGVAQALHVLAANAVAQLAGLGVREIFRRRDAPRMGSEPARDRPARRELARVARADVGHVAANRPADRELHRSRRAARATESARRVAQPDEQRRTAERTAAGRDRSFGDAQHRERAPRPQQKALHAPA
jgi:hypothetical protein